MKKLLALTTAVSGLLLAPAVMADDGYYVSLKAGIGGPQTLNVREKFPPVPNVPEITTFSFDTSFHGGAAVGYNMREFNFELELMAYTSDYDQNSEDGSVLGKSAIMSTLMGNTFLEFDMDYPVVPFVGLGLGYAFVNYKDEGDKNHEAALQGMVGIKYPISDTLSFSGEYRYFTTITGTTFGVYDSHSFSTTLRYKFFTTY